MNTSAGTTLTEFPFRLVPVGDGTGIQQIENDDTLNGKLSRGTFYDLGGRRFANPKHGLYIINGNKVVVNP